MPTINLTPPNYDFVIIQNDTLSFSFTVDSPDVNTPVDLTGTTIKLQWKKKSGATAVKEIAVGTGITITGDDNNIIAINTVIDFVGSYRYELQVTFPNNDNITYLQGTTTSIAEITI